MKKKTIGIIAISVLCAFAIFAGAMFTHQYLDAKNSVEQFDELTDLIADVETGPETKSPEESESTEEPELSEEEQEYIAKFNRLTDIDKGKIIERMDVMYSSYLPEVKENA